MLGDPLLSLCVCCTKPYGEPVTVFNELISWFDMNASNANSLAAALQIGRFHEFCQMNGILFLIM